MNLFRHESTEPKHNAQMNLRGRSHYVNDDTLKFFHSRILDCYPVLGGAALLLVETKAADHRNTSREACGVVFAIDGTHITEFTDAKPDAVRRELATWIKAHDKPGTRRRLVREAFKREREKLQYELRALKGRQLNAIAGLED